MVVYFWTPLAMLQNISIYLVLATLAPQEHAKRSLLTTLAPSCQLDCNSEAKMKSMEHPKRSIVDTFSSIMTSLWSASYPKWAPKSTLEASKTPSWPSLWASIPRFTDLCCFECCKETPRSSNASDGPPKSNMQKLVLEVPSKKNPWQTYWER